MKLFIWMRTAIAMIACVAMFAGCEDEDETRYDVTVVWTIAGQPGLCQQPLSADHGGGTLIFETIRINLYEEQGDPEPYRTSTAQCGDKTYTIEDLERGTYWVELEAMAEDPPGSDAMGADAGVTDTVSLQTRAYYVSSRKITVPAIDDQEYEFPLQLGKGSIDVSWDFEQGQCSSAWNQVIAVRVTLTGLSDSLDSGEVDCEESSFLFEDLAWDVYDVKVEGYDINGNVTHEGGFDAPVEIRPGTKITGLDGLVTLVRVTS